MPTKPAQDAEYLTLAQVHARFQAHPKTVRRAIAAGSLPPDTYVIWGDTYRIHRERFAAWLESATRIKTNPAA